MNPNTNFVIIYPTCGSVYLRWTLCSIASVLERGNYHGEILLIVKDEIEAEIASKIYPDLRTLVINAVKPWDWPAYMYQSILIHNTCDLEITKKGNVMLFDSDILVYDDLNPFLDKIDGQLWIDRIYQQSKSARYKKYVLPVCEKHGLHYEQDFNEYNAGCWSIPTPQYSEFARRFGDMLLEHYRVDDRGRQIGWTDQPFFSISCILSGLKPKVLEEYLDFRNDDYYVAMHGARKGFKHFQGKHRSNKAEWQTAIEEEGFIENLDRKSKQLLTPDEYRYLWHDSFSSKTFFPTETLRYRVWKTLKRLLYRGGRKH